MGMSVFQVIARVFSVKMNFVSGVVLFVTFSTVFIMVESGIAQPVTIEQRVACQKIIEDINWSNRHWPETNKTQKPSRSEIISDQQVYDKVINNLQMEAALAGLYGIEIDNAAVQVELNRIARKTKSPDRLREIFNALGNDPDSIGNCLARPALVQQHLYNKYVWDRRYHGDLRRQAENVLIQQDFSDTLSESGGQQSLKVLIRKSDQDGDQQIASDDAAKDTFQAIELAPAKFAHEAVRLADYILDPLQLSQLGTVTEKVLRETKKSFVFEKMLSRADDRIEVLTLLWTKRSFSQWWQSERSSWQVFSVPFQKRSIPVKNLVQPIITGKAQNFGAPQSQSNSLSVDSWKNIPVVPVTRTGHTSIWTGTEMILWGGYDENYIYLNSGNRYDPVTDTWKVISSIGAPSIRPGHSAIWTGAEMIIWGGENQNTGGRYDPVADTWVDTATEGANSTFDSGHTAIWTGSEMIVWGGVDGNMNLLNTGSCYTPGTDTWRALTTMGAPSYRSGHSAIWSGTEMIVWGGKDEHYATLNSGGRYDPVSDVWTAIDTAQAPLARGAHTAIWTGSKMIIWGGETSHYEALNSGSCYNPVSDTWSVISLNEAPSARIFHTAIWTGTEMLVWGGDNGGGSYDPDTDTWKPITTIGEPIGNSWFHTAIWTGTEMIVWGGSNTGTGGRYTPKTDTWIATATTDVPNGRYDHTAIWTGSEMIIWGGMDSSETTLSSGYCYYPITDTWTELPALGAPADRTGHTVIWTGTEMIVWGGIKLNNYTMTYRNSGGRFNPVLNRWTSETSTAQAPAVRFSHTAIWTGVEMVVWGGIGLASDLNSGGRYNPSTDTWRTTASIGAPGGRSMHTTIWTGTEMVVWGGNNDDNALFTGGRYNPVNNAWTGTTAVTGSPSARSGHTAVWTGHEMIVWGGFYRINTDTYLNSGGRYNPTSDVWVETNTAGAPAKRYGHTAIWTGNEMIIWGGQDGTGGRYDPACDTWATMTAVGAPATAPGHTAVWVGDEMIVWGGMSRMSGACDNEIHLYRYKKIRFVPACIETLLLRRK